MPPASPADIADDEPAAVDPASVDPARGRGPGSAAEVFWVFLRLGLTSFGGPVAHLGYFRTALVARRRWVSEAEYAELVALCQLLPGPASSQTGFALGLRRAGWAGGLAAFAGFTLPSALLMLAFAAAAARLEGPLWQGAVHGLKLSAVAVVAQAVLGMARTLTPDLPRLVLAAAAGAVALLLGGAVGQVTAIAAGAAAGLLLRLPSAATREAPAHAGVRRRTGAVLVVAVAALLAGLPLLAQATGNPIMRLLDGYARAGALVFGGGHVVLPLLEAEVVRPGGVTPDAFLAGYGAAQALPGPLFAVAAYLGAVGATPPNGAVGGVLALLALFLPGLLLVAGVLPFWGAVRGRPGVGAAVAGVNAAVVGLLAAARWRPVATSAIHGPQDLALAAAAALALILFKTPPWLAVAALVAAGVALAA